MSRKKFEIPPKITIMEMLMKLNVSEEKIERLTEGILEVTFFDTYTKCEDESEDMLKLTGYNIITGEENYIFINLKDSTLEYHDITNGINIVREYLPNGFDLSLIKQL